VTGVNIVPWDGPLRVEIRDVEPPPPDPRADARWRELTAANPRLFNGEILAVARVDHGLIRVRRDEYRRLCVQPEVPTGVEQLSVTGVVLARNARGLECVMLGRRGHATRMYGGLWELGPSGGVDAPPQDGSELTTPDLIAQLGRELREEAGLDAPLSDARVRCLTRDAAAMSLDVVIECRLPRTDPPSESWEYDQAAWVPLPELRAFARRHDLIGTTRALLAWFGWI
jgi:hypothetical protein